MKKVVYYINYNSGKNTNNSLTKPLKQTITIQFFHFNKIFFIEMAQINQEKQKASIIYLLFWRYKSLFQ